MLEFWPLSVSSQTSCQIYSYSAYVTVLDVLQLISIVSIGRWNILCSEQFAFDALENPTAFCIVQG